MNNQSNGQSNTHKQNKPINQNDQQHQLNAMMTEREHNQNVKHRDFYAAVRPERPPEVATEPYPKEKPMQKGKQIAKPSLSRRVTTRSHLEETNQSLGQQVYQQPSQPMYQPITYQQPQQHVQPTSLPVQQQNIQLDTELPIQPKTIDKKKKPRAKRLLLEIKYDIVSDVLNQKADIDIGDLIKVAPTLRRKLVDECRPRRTLSKNNKPQPQPMQVKSPEATMALIEDEEISTTAVYTTIAIGNMNIKALVDCGAAKTCISKALADTLGLEIDVASESVFTLGNGSKQSALGMIYDVPIAVNDNMVIPCTTEVLPSCPAHLILGNNWLNRAKARIDFSNARLKVTYKHQTAELDINFIRRSATPPKVQTYHLNYKQPVSQTHNKKKVHFVEVEGTDESDGDTDEDDSSDYSEESSEDDFEVEVEEKEESLLVLEDDSKEEIIITSFKEVHIIQASKTGVIIPANSSKTITMKRPEKESLEWTYQLDIINPKLKSALGYFDPSSTLIVNKRTIDIKFFNRTNVDIYFNPEEEIAVLEKLNLDHDAVVLAYDVQDNSEMCYMETDQQYQEDDDETLIEEELFGKFEISNLPKDILKGLKILLKQYTHIFDWNNDTMGHTNLVQHKIVVEKDTLPISHRPYRMSPIEADYLQKELDKYCKLGIITPSNSPWAAPVILVKKKNGEYRMVIDYRKLNAVTKKDSYPLPRIDDLLDTLGKAKIFSALDMRAGFHQVPLEEGSKELTAFTTKYGTYHYNMLPMGLVNSPATFQRLIDLCFRPLINKCLVAYIDDLNVYSNNYYEHLHHLKQVFDCIKLANLKLNPEKCYFFKEQLNFLGYIVTKNGIQTDPAKIQKIIDYPIPKTVTQIRSFLGLASYYRRFIKNFAAIARPLHEQTKTKKKLPWTEKTTESFSLLKKLLTTTPVLVRPDFNKEFILVTDASKLGLGCILTQLDEDGKEHPIMFASRGLRSGESNYASTKLECLAVVWAVKMFRPYLFGRKFTIITDHSALTGLFKTSNPTGIIARWIVVLSEYEFDIKYRPGRVNESADFMSRLGY